MGAPTLIRAASADDLPTLHRLWRTADGHLIDDGVDRIHRSFGMAERGELLHLEGRPGVPDGSAARLGPIVCAPGATDGQAIATVLGVLAASLAMPVREDLVRLVIGAVHPAVEVLRSLGFVVADRDTYLASDAAICDLRRCLGAADLW